jgi:hypothetical protein
MKKRFLLVAATFLAVVATMAQFRITSFKPTGEIIWTNSAQVGAYRVEWANSPTGQWTSLASLNPILAETNRVIVQVPLSNSPAFYRVGWIQPDPIGNWDCRGFDSRGTLVITGQFSFSSKGLLLPNPPIYSVAGVRRLQYAGPPTNSAWYFPFIGTSGVSGRLEVRAANLSAEWPSNCSDCGNWFSGTLWPNSWTGYWGRTTFIGGQIDGTFQATRQ